MAVTVSPLTPDDAPAWAAMRRELGVEWIIDNIDAMVASYLATGTIDHLPHVVLIAKDDAGSVGFAEVSLRQFAEGCETSPVGYLEGWFVAKRTRGSGVGRALVDAGVAWARERGCREFASDAELHNAASLAAHEKLGFDPVCDIRCFRKLITDAD
ncbi:MAG: GNAT family N-acetyltransferase [Phycisphaerales bacterium]